MAYNINSQTQRDLIPINGISIL